MAPVLTALSLLAVNAATWSVAAVPAAGRQEALLTLDAPAAIHLSAKSASGTACEVLDRVRGPFARSGAVGGASCELDLLLDAGQYKVRLESPRRGRGQVALSATPFEELHAAPPRLAPGSGLVTTLRPRQQATFWLSVKDATAPLVRVSGRHAGDVRLWRNGEWLEPATLHHAQVSPRPGQPLHEWWLDGALEPGDYQLVVYGRDSTTVTGSSGDDSLTVEMGFRPGPAEQSVAFTLPASGVFAVQVPAAHLAGVLTLEAAPPSAVELHGHRGNLRTPAASCRIEKGALVAECSAVLDGRGALSVFLVRGPPGTRGTLEWAEYRSAAAAQGLGGFYGPSAERLDFLAPGGPALVAVHDLPVDGDAVPLGCLVQQLGPQGDVTGVVARSVPTLRDGEKLEREFNYREEGALLWFEVASGGNLLQRAGLTSRRFRVSTGGGRKSSCEVYRVDPRGTLTRLTQTKPDGGGCDEVLALEPGLYQLQLSGGLTGIEKLAIAPEGDAAAKALAARGGCLVPSVELTRGPHRVVLNRVGAVTVRGLQVQALPLSGAGPTHLQLDAHQVVTVPVRLSAPVTVRSAGGAAFACALSATAVSARAGECTLPAATDVLTLRNQGDAPVALTVSRSGAMPPLAAPAPWTPALAPLPRLSPDVPAFFDFAQRQARSVQFDVEAPGLYHVTTQGLLSTECTLRTPVIDEVASDRGSGRGRNCLVQTYLQKGRYRFTATTLGASRGRGALILTRRPVRELPGVTGEGEQYFRVGADELVQQRLTVKAPGEYELGTTAQGTAGLQCRLDDPDGWPVEAVPSPCVNRRELRAGTWAWTQLPLTVESMRRTRLARVRDEVVLRGQRAHRVEPFTWYRAELGPDGKDEFLFSLEGETELDVVLTQGMQGRLFLLEKGRPPRAVEVVPPMQPSGEGDAAYEAEQPPASEREDAESDQGDGEGEAGGDGESVEDGDSGAASVEVAQARSAPPPPTGVKVTLPAGEYRLLTEHSRADVGVTYQLHLGSLALLPGMTRTLPVPSTVPVVVPRDGTLRLRTEGESDVRCRLLDAQGRLVLEGSENGADWNCALAEPIAKGRYLLLLESETQQPGETRLSLALPPVEDLGVAADGRAVPLRGSVVSLALPPAAGDVVHELTFRAEGPAPLSCALEAADGAVVHRASRVRTCALLVRPGASTFRVRLWTTDGATTAVSSLRTRPVVRERRPALPGDQALRLELPRAGRYVTAPQAFCIGGDEAGLLRACGPSASFEAGSVVFSHFGVRPLPLALTEEVATAADAAQALALTRRPSLQVVRAPAPSLFLLEARVPHGERAAPMCAFDGAGTVRERRDTTCFAAARVGLEATSRLWAASEAPVRATLTRRAVALPAKGAPLAPGRSRLTFAGTGRFPLPREGRTRLELTLPADAWAVLVADDGAALELCGPTAGLQRCVVTGQGGDLVLLAAAGQAEVTAVRLEGDAPAVAFTGLYEDTPRQPGTLRLAVPASAEERTATVDGALRCTVALADGARVGSCRARVPPHQAAELIVEHDAGPVRALVHAPGRERAARLGLTLPLVPGAPLPPAVAVPLGAGRVDRALVVTTEGVVRVAAERGVCGLFRGSELLAVDGLDAGCELVRVLAPGTYRVVVRPFAGRIAPGTLRWTAEPVTQLTEGVGPESWLAPGEARLFRFETANRGRLGLGAQAPSELLECAVYDDGHRLLGEGCQQYLSLEKGRYLLTVRNPPAPGAAPLAVRPVLLGLSGERTDIPDEYLQDFFRRNPGTP